MKRIIFWRRICQTSVLLILCLLPWLNLRGFHEIRGSLFALDVFGFPFADPASASQAIVAGGMHGVPPLASLYAGACVSLLLALFCGRVFCGWLCPYGLFSELFSMPRKKEAGWAKNAFWLKTGVTFIAIIIAAIFAWPLITILSMPGQISLIPFFAFEGVTIGATLSLLAIPLAALLVELWAGSRLWCKYICPQSVFLGFSSWSLPAKVPGLRIGWNAKNCSCGKNSPCREACGLNLNPRRRNGPPRRDCQMCGGCVAECQKYGKALDWNIKPL